MIGLASELIKAPPELQRVVTAALGNAWIVKDRGAARKIARSKGNSARAVTLNGEVFLSNGAVIAGREGRGSLISRPRERKELESVLDQVDRDLKASSQEISNSDGVLHSLREEELQIQQSRQQAEENARKLTQKTQKATLDLNQLHQQINWKKQQIDQQKKQLETSYEELLKLDASITDNQKAIQETSQQLKEKNAGLAKLSLDEIQSQVFHWNTTVAVARKARQEAERRHSDLLSSIERTNLQVQDLKNQVQSLLDERKQIDIEIGKLGESIETITIQTDGLDEKITPAEKDLNRLDHEYNDLQTDLISAQQKVTVAERAMAQSKLEYARSKDAVDNLQKKIEEDMGLVILEYSEDMAAQTPLPLEGWVEHASQSN